MGVDHETEMKYVGIYIDKNPAFMKVLENNDIAIMGEEEHEKKPQMVFNNDVGVMRTEEYYFDEKSNSLVFSGCSQTLDGEVYLSFDLPLSDVVLIDILQHSIKRLNKLKTALETLK